MDEPGGGVKHRQLALTYGLREYGARHRDVLYSKVRNDRFPRSLELTPFFFGQSEKYRGRGYTHSNDDRFVNLRERHTLRGNVINSNKYKIMEAQTVASHNSLRSSSSLGMSSGGTDSSEILSNLASSISKTSFFERELEGTGTGILFSESKKGRYKRSDGRCSI
jgi:hypothetical protein